MPTWIICIGGPPRNRPSCFTIFALIVLDGPVSITRRTIGFFVLPEINLISLPTVHSSDRFAFSTIVTFILTRTFAKRAINLLILFQIDIVGLTAVHSELTSTLRTIFASKHSSSLASRTLHFLVFPQVHLIGGPLFHASFATALRTDRQRIVAHRLDDVEGVAAAPARVLVGGHDRTSVAGGSGTSPHAFAFVHWSFGGCTLRLSDGPSGRCSCGA